MAIAVSCLVVPNATLALPGVTDKEATAADVTATPADPMMPLCVAVMLAVPCATLVANPLAFTVVTDAFEELQVTEAVTIFVVLSEYVAVAVSCCELPCAKLALAGVTLMLEIVTTVIVSAALPVTVPFCPAVEAVMVVVP